MAILRKIKDRVKGLAQKVKLAIKLKPAKRTAQKISPTETSRIVLGTHEVAVERSKFSYPQDYSTHRAMPQELPGGYGQDKMILQVRDPYWLHTFWEVTLNTFARLKRELGDNFYKAKRVLRVYDVTAIDFNGSNANRFFDIEISEHASNWYIDANGPGRSWVVDLGLRLADGRFITILRSNVVHTPLDGPSSITDEEWMTPDELFAKLYGLGFGLGASGRMWRERFKESLSSGGLGSMASPVKKAEQRGFWLAVNCELIVYGATEPNAKVVVQDKEIKLRPDGTFTLRFSLPDGKQVIPVKATSADEKEEREITPTVSRETKTKNA